MSGAEYAGQELLLFAEAVRWKRYVASVLKPWIGTRVLEVGAGIGTATAAFANPAIGDWWCLDPDPRHVAILEGKVRDGRLPAGCRAQLGVVEDLDAAERFDTILYIDVLEHLADDRGELTRAARHLSAGGTLIVLGPAHPWLFTRFDAVVGHRRRYTRASLAALVPAGCRLERTRYLDSAGLLLSAGNRLLLKRALPTPAQIRFWDDRIIPISKVLDRRLGYRLGKSVLGVWRRLGQPLP